MGSFTDQGNDKKIIGVPWGKVMIVVTYVIHILVLVTNISRIVVGYFANVQDSIVECRLHNFSSYLIAAGAIFLLITVINAGFRISYLDKKMKKIVGKYKVPYIMMHMKGSPQNMIRETNYNDMLKEIIKYFSKKINQAISCLLYTSDAADE